MTKISIIGKWNNRSSEEAPFFLEHRGFTFLEIIVVIFLIGLMIALATPRIRYAVLTDNLKTTTRRIIGMVKELRNEAIREQKEYVVHFDLDSNRFWIDSPSMTEQEQARAREKASPFPEDVRVLDIWYRAKGKRMRGETTIRFNKKGYVQPSVIHLGSEDGRSFTLELSPFLGRVKVIEKYVEYEA
ncbi:MAG: prepilin-type N-terminal cleavage/methylation domain-containing protein [Desulfobacteraceae bacterium]|jgi:general secretion pathway protein H